MKQLISVKPEYGDKGSHVEALQIKLISAGYEIGNVDGDFGNKTKNALLKYQKDKGISATGNLDNATLNSLELEVEIDPSEDETKAILRLVDISKISKTHWENRGFAPYGYYYGMALMFAKLYNNLKQRDAIAIEISKPLNQFKPDALFRFDDVFADLGMSNSTSEVNRLRHLFVLMFGLGLMESSGKYCCGWDRGKLTGWGNKSKIITPTSSNSEAGLFQTSFDIVNSVNPMTKITLLNVLSKYENDPKGYAEYFSKGVRNKDLDKENIGDGDGLEFQKLSKEVPGFAVEFTAVALRNITGHWNPVYKIGDKKDGLEIKKECDDLLKTIQEYIDEKGFDGFTASAKLVEQTHIEKKSNILRLATSLGQNIALQNLFDYAPDSHAIYWGVIDFNKPSSKERFFIFNLNDNSVKQYLVAHGERTGDLNADTFSNENGSHCTSLGIYKTKTVFQSGSHGKALGLKGLETTNSNAELREIIIHKADYVESNYKNTGRSGRSFGCFAVNPKDINEVINCLRDGSYINAWHNES